MPFTANLFTASTESSLLYLAVSLFFLCFLFVVYHLITDLLSNCAKRRHKSTSENIEIEIRIKGVQIGKYIISEQPEKKSK